MLELLERAAGAGGGESTRAASPSAFGLVPEQLAERGCPGSVNNAFQRLQRPWTWTHVEPPLHQAAARWLVEHTDLRLPEVERDVGASDGTTRVVYRSGGDAFEAVHMPRDVRAPRVTMCLSSQVGCGMGCRFCATASMGLVRNLSAGEIVGQVLATMDRIGPKTSNQLSLVFMGMGEPLHNVTEVVHAISTLCHPLGLGLSPRRITVSTSGVVKGIDELARAPRRPRLALSLNATTNPTRTAIMPVNRKWDLAELRAALGRWPFEARERITVEYVMLAGINDADDDVDRLVAWLDGLPHMLNLIPFNPHHAAPGMRASSPERVSEFAAALHAAGCRVTVRVNRGRDVAAACGQLVVGAGSGR
ncbi:Dual-specificity RNA methyltransferase RlmN [Enhygromyxa salina]|uniref:Dual-specificity RNA methyltransferase RlmN n=2 Tax=Enhygromyxa salina TaxID=215803 RepID=A0A2S9YMN6_9BACT|nr:Dual-specificity RNA methyltransferase RlmN [Enhygromyxa salina]